MLSLKGNQSKSGEIQVIIGPMLSGKSTELNLRIQRYKIAQYRCFVIDEATDTERLTVQTKRTSLETYLELADQYDVIGIDDGHCYDTIASFSNDLAEKGKTVIVAARDSTHQMKGYSGILTLVPLAERVDKLYAICVHCSQNASFTHLVDSSESEIKEDGSNLSKDYEPVCRRCFRPPPPPPLPAQSPTSGCSKSPHQSITSSSPLKESFKENVKPLSECSTRESPDVSKISASVPNQDETFSPPSLTHFKSTVNRTKLFSSP